MEEKHEQLRAWGIYDDYRRIHRACAELIGDPDAGLEALKRALFLGWYDLSEPACFTGIFQLAGEVNRQVLSSVENLVRDGGLDSELEWMLPWYHRITDYYFTIHGDLPVLQAFFIEADSHLYQKASTSAKQFRARGQMGGYWVAVLHLTPVAGDVGPG